MFELYVRHEWWFAAAQLALAMLGMGATLSAGDFLGVFRQPRAFAIGAAVQIAGTPLLALALTSMLPLPPGIAFGLLVVGVMPGGAMSNVATYFARGNVALSIALTAAITLACIATTPLALRLLAGELIPAGFSMPVAAIALDIAICLLIPLLLGMLVGQRLGSAARRGAMARWCIRLSFAVVACIAIGSAGAGRLDVGAHSALPLAAIAALAVLCQLAGTAPGWLLGLSRGDLAALAIENSIRNTNLALLLKVSLFPITPGVANPLADGVLFAALLYGGLAAPLAIPLILVHRRLAAQ
ncbi:bile acid:sodium symporter [bacterium]|nr:bile acid:sodium symporter [bacterium]